MGLINETSEAYYEGETGGYRFISLKDVVRNFMAAYVGDGKLIDRASIGDAVFHAKRAIQEFTYDAARVEKSQEVEIVDTLSVPMPQDFVKEVKIAWVDNSGIEHPMYEARITRVPSQSPIQDEAGNYIYDEQGDIIEGSSLTEKKFKEGNYNNNDFNINSNNEYILNDFDNSRELGYGGMYGLDPELAQSNGVYVIDYANGKIGFSSDIAGKIVNITYISDGLGTDAEMKVHKFLEEAIYMHVAHAILSSKLNVQEYIVRRYKKYASSALANAKIRLLNLRSHEMTQTMRGKSKNIK